MDQRGGSGKTEDCLRTRGCVASRTVGSTPASTWARRALRRRVAGGQDRGYGACPAESGLQPPERRARRRIVGYERDWVVLRSPPRQHSAGLYTVRTPTKLGLSMNPFLDRMNESGAFLAVFACIQAHM